MKLWKIIFYIFCTLLILYGVYYFKTEGFQNTVLNVPYNTKYNEVFLVAPQNVPLYTDSLNADGTLATNPKSSGETYYTNASTYDDAQATCKSLGATLATKDQLGIAVALGGFWGVASWAADKNMYALIPQAVTGSFTYTLATASPGPPTTAGYSAVEQVGAPAIVSRGLAYPACWGVKPSNPTANITPFNQSTYSMFSQPLLAAVINPAPGDLLQTVFTQDQAVYALQQTNYNIGVAEGTNPARKLLMNSLSTGSANKDIYIDAVGQDQYTSDQANLSLEPCAILRKTFTDYRTKFDTLRQVMRDVSGGVVAMEFAKQENSRFQLELESVCTIESPTTSPACARLATLDFDLLYGTSNSDLSTSRLAKLELLNATLFQREQELCSAMNALYAVDNIIMCSPSLQSTSLPDCICTTGGKNPQTGDPSLCSSANSGYSWSMKGLQPNGEAYLKILLKQISPYFSVSAYQSLLSGIDQLSLVIQVPTLNDFKSSDQKFSAANQGINTIQSFLENW